MRPAIPGGSRYLQPVPGHSQLPFAPTKTEPTHHVGWVNGVDLKGFASRAGMSLLNGRAVGS